MAKTRRKKSKNLSWVFLGALLVLTVVIGSLSSSKPSPTLPSRAATINAAGTGAEAIQRAIDSAQNGDTVIIPKGTYQGNTTTPLGAGDDIFVSADRGAADTCFVRIEGKTLTLKGEGNKESVIFGEGHDSKADVDPYKRRAGVCILRGNVTLDNLRIKEFQKRCVVAIDSTLTVKNSTVDGCDEGGISLLGDSSALIVNNMLGLFNFGGVMLWQNSHAKIVNNILHGANIMFFFHPNTGDTASAEVINNVLSGGSKITQVDWWKSEAGKLSNVKASYNLIQAGDSPCTPPLDYCDSFPGKLTGDPLYIEPVVDPRGFAAWANFGFKDGSPAVGAGDPSVPGTRTLGPSGGPCTDPSSSVCSNYIAQNAPRPPAPPTATQAPTSPPQPTDVPAASSSRTSVSSVPPKELPIGNGQPASGGIFIIENIGFDKLTVKGINFGGTSVRLGREIETGSALEYPLSGVCGSGDIPAGVLYADANQSLSYASLTVHCNKVNVFDIY